MKFKQKFKQKIGEPIGSENMKLIGRLNFE